MCSSDLARLHPEYLAACAGGALARPDHGIGLLTSDPGGLVGWARWMETTGRPAGYAAECCYRETDHGVIPPVPWPPPNLLILISASDLDEVKERTPAALELEALGWRWGWHHEPLLAPVAEALAEVAACSPVRVPEVRRRAGRGRRDEPGALPLWRQPGPKRRHRRWPIMDRRRSPEGP